MRAIGWVYTIGTIAFYILFSATTVGQSFWLSDWTNDAVVYFNKTYPDSKRDTRIGVYAGLGTLQGKWKVNHNVSTAFYAYLTILVSTHID